MVVKIYQFGLDLYVTVIFVKKNDINEKVIKINGNLLHNEKEYQV